MQKNGHDWGPWIEIIGTKTRTEGPHEPSAMHLYREVTHQIQVPKWQRKCKNCGYASTVKNKPEEVEIDELEQRIKALQKKRSTRDRK